MASVIVIPSSQISRVAPASASAFGTMKRLIVSSELTLQLLLAVTVKVKLIGPPVIISRGPGI